MVNTFMTSLKYSFVEKANMTLYLILKMPVIGKKIGDKYYKETKAKIIFGTIGFIINSFLRLFGKSLFLFLSIYLPSHYISQWIGKNSEYELGLQSFIILCFIAGSVLNSVVFNENAESYKMIKVMRINPKKYYIGKIISRVIVDFIGFMIFFIKFPAANTLILLLELSFARIIGEYLNIFLFGRFEFILRKCKAVIVSAVLVILSCGYGLGIIGVVFNFKAVVENVFTFTILLLLAAASFYKIFKYDDYKGISIKMAVKGLVVSQSKLNKDLNFGSVQLNNIDEKLLNSSKFNGKTGYEYLNSIFFYRNNKIVKRSIIIKCAAITISFIALSIWVNFFADKDINEMFEDIKKISPILVFFMYMLSSTEKISKSMFYNCDLSLLIYGFYKRPQDILKNFTSRIKKIMFYNSIPVFILIIEFCMFIFYIGKADRFMEIVPILISIVTLSCFFTIYSVFMYYILQPYTKDLEVKSPVFKFTNFAMSIGCYFCIKIKTAPQYFTIAVIAVTIISIPIFFFVIYKYAPRTFRLK